ncbi:hypothetical protein PCYB_001410 [Plasmodium cynomolgi strain B]|uniref:Schizont-infected cell agglutination C-terminal domain-containing protein n=1 Tax=Plasmodium cynomolgi (strain B) TaxID=1120755 RepID=K6UND7_PLACD|nr:hypothetical protein PCYB_001410 [Plasmodium cynomolgi strain B]GAB69393.1 hypothetical protein PCYB_001410 [Plasmodium cynomolgi strain B]
MASHIQHLDHIITMRYRFGRNTNNRGNSNSRQQRNRFKATNQNIIEHIQHDEQAVPPTPDTSHGYTMTRKRPPRSTPKERRSRGAGSKGTVHRKTIIDIYLEFVDESQHGIWELHKNDFIQILVQEFAQEFTQHEFMQGERESMENQQESMDGKQAFPNDEQELMKDERVQDGRTDEFEQEKCTQDEEVRGLELTQNHVSTDSRSTNGGTINPEEVEK